MRAPTHQRCSLAPSLAGLATAWACVLAIAAGCGTSEPPPACDPQTTACEIAHDFGELTLSPGEERDGLCHSWTLNNPTELWVNTVQLVNDGAHHHSNWFFVPDLNYAHEDGRWDCDAVHFTEVGAALVGGVLFAQSTQSHDETQRFPQGVVVRVPAYARVIGSVHLLNPAAQAAHTGLRMTLRTVPQPEVKVQLSPLRLTYHDLHIRPGVRSEFRGACNLRQGYESRRKDPFSLKLYYVLPHYHALGRSFRLRIHGGARAGDLLYELADGYGEANGRTYDPPIDLAGADGLDFTCGFDNPGIKEVGWGIGDQEMCVMLGFADSKVVYDAEVSKGAVVAEESGTVRSDGPCNVAAYNF